MRGNSMHRPLGARAVKALVSSHMDVVEKALFFMCRKPGLDGMETDVGTKGLKGFEVEGEAPLWVTCKQSTWNTQEEHYLSWGPHGQVAYDSGRSPTKTMAVAVPNPTIRKALITRGWLFDKTIGRPPLSLCETCPKYLICLMEGWV